MPTAKQLYAEVALPLPVEQTFTYRVPAELAAAAGLGSQVLVPFRQRLLTGFITSLDERTDLPSGVKLKDIRQVLEREPLVTPELLRLARWIADYYLASLGEVLHSVFPPGIARRTTRVVRLVGKPDAKRLSEARAATASLGRILDHLAAHGEVSAAAIARRFGPDATQRALRTLVKLGLVEQASVFARPPVGPRRVRMVRVTDRERAALALEGLRRRAPVQARCLEELLERGECEAARLARTAKTGAQALQRLRQLGLVAESFRTVFRRPPELEEEGEILPHPRLTAHQAAAVQEIVAAVRAGGFQTFLLHGITASGKTEVYLQAIEEVLRQQRTAIVLVPEIALAPQTVRQVLARFGATVAVLHSRLSVGERFDAWHQIRRGEVNVVVGARSAIFAPLERLGLVVVDEEHEASYKQEESPRYHARSVAIVRARLASGVALLGSATPCLESFWNAREGKYRLLSLPERVEAGELPKAQVVDLRHERGRPPRVLSAPLRERIAERLRRREQVILFLNRRGFSPFVQCKDCGWVGRCPDCDLTLTYHEQGHLLRCHYCDHGEEAPAVCPSCRGPRLDYKGVGTQRVESEVARLFPEARLARMDLDSMRRRGAHAQVYRRMLRGQIDILLGTQMVAKGFHFPRVGLVGVVNADVALNLPDFRASEKAFQLLTQVAGRAGRGSEPGEVVLQTYAPGHHGIVCAAAHDFLAFYEQEIRAREELVYPPFGRITRLLLRGDDRAELEAEGKRLRALLEEELTRPGAEWQRHGRNWFRLVGPAEAPLARVRGRYRRHLLIKCSRWEALHDLVKVAARRFREEPGSGKDRVELVTDVDPIEML